MCPWVATNRFGTWSRTFNTDKFVFRTLFIDIATGFLIINNN